MNTLMSDGSRPGWEARGSVVISQMQLLISDLVTSNNNTNNNGSNHNDNLDNSNIILPSGRGKPRETERVINRDVENLEKAQEEARARLKAFLDRAEAEGKLEHVVPNESGE